MTSFTRAVAAENSGNLEEARARYLEVLQAEPQNPRALHRLGMVELRLGRPREAVILFQKSLSIAKDLEVYLDFGAAMAAMARWDATAAVYAAALRVAPASVDAHYGLALALHRQGRPQDAEPHYRQVLATHSHLGEVHNNLGVALQDLGRFAEAAAAHREAARLDPADAAAWSKLGVVLHRMGQGVEAEAALRKAVGFAPQDADNWHNLTGLLDAAGRSAEAFAAGRLAVALDPASARNWLALGNAARAGERREEAWRAASAAVRLEPSDPAARNNLANALRDLGRLRDAVAHYRAALDLQPDFPVAEINLALLLSSLRDADGALAVLMALLARQPDNGEAWRRLGGVLAEAVRPDAAVAVLRKAVALGPGEPDVHADLAMAAAMAGWSSVSVDACRRVLRLVPDHAAALGQLVHQQRLVCYWRDLDRLEEALLRRVRAGAEGVSPFDVLSCASTLADQQSAAARWAAAKARGAVPVARPAAVVRDGRLRIGYLSADFREHAMGHLMVDALETHDRSHFAITAYSTGIDDGSALRRRFERGIERFVELRRHTDADAAQAITADGIDILVDLTGFTTFSRTSILAARPAPVQVNWLGYPGTLGAEYVDYIVADPTVIAPGEERNFTERVVRLPDCYQPNDRRRSIAEATPTRADCGLPADGFVFCCFNSAYKLTPALFDGWARILAAVPGSVLWLYAGNPQVIANLRREGEARGLESNRLVFAKPLPHAEHLARHRLADLFLDTLPYNAHTTASDALWAGLPVLTRRGTTFAGRVAASLLRAAGLPDLIVDDQEAYETAAVDLARSPDRLRDLRQRLARNRPDCPLFDTPRFTRHLEAAYRAMWDIRQGGGAPRPITIAAGDTGGPKSAIQGEGEAR
ncbi:tetratricopeptide repeat protein [Azospirillum humicireducens]|uniref:protein O-GlcNAc transferase n=1 Tax=Azospirillum humicireducens TaxID=1226968 RepID=A0A160JDS9_9PROT|nr:tetratricopeptide repeat protein [Azospirillum humicireducens]ANC90880.1 tetratricopeptide repeat protein [Azospirillum humicireducens]